MDNSGDVSGEEFLGAATILTGDFAFGGSASLVDFLMDNASNDWDTPRVTTEILQNLETDLSDEDFMAVNVIVEFLDQIEYGG